MDGASNDIGFRDGMMLISLEGHKIYCAICFRFKTSTNEAEYEALIVSLRLAHELQVHNVKFLPTLNWW